MLWLTLKKLKSKSPEARKAAVEKLRAVGGPTVLEPLLEAMSDLASEVREAAAEALGENRDPKSFQALLGALGDESAAVRSAVAGALRRHGDPAALEPLMPLLQDPDSAVRDRAIVTLRSLGWHGSLDEVAGSATAVGSAASAAAQDPAPVSGLRGEESGRGPSSATASSPAPVPGPAPTPAPDLTLMGGVDVVLQAIREGPVPRRVAMVERVAGAREQSVIEAVVGALSDASPAVRRAAAISLGKGGEAEHFGALVRSLEDPDTGVRAAAVRAVGLVGGRRAVDPLLKLVRDPFGQVRSAVATALGGVRDASCLHPLLEFLQDPDKEARQAAVEGLASLGDRVALEPILLALTDSASNVRQAASRALRQLDPFWERSELAQQMIPQFQEALRSRDYALQFTAMEFLKAVGAPLFASQEAEPRGPVTAERRSSAVLALVDLLGDAEPGMRQMAAEGLGRVGEPAAAMHLTGLLGDTERAVRRSAAKSLQLLGWRPNDAGDTARWHVAREEWDTAAACGPAAVEALLGALQCEDLALRRKAVEALRKIGDPQTIRPLAGELREGGVAAPALAAIEVILRSKGGDVTSADLTFLAGLSEGSAAGGATAADVVAVRDLARAEQERRKKG